MAVDDALMSLLKLVILQWNGNSVGLCWGGGGGAEAYKSSFLIQKSSLSLRSPGGWQATTTINAFFPPPQRKKAWIDHLCPWVFLAGSQPQSFCICFHAGPSVSWFSRNSFAPPYAWLNKTHPMQISPKQQYSLWDEASGAEKNPSTSPETVFVVISSFGLSSKFAVFRRSERVTFIFVK